jgi:hypothetical protein
MAIDPSIALGVKPVQIESPINQMAKMYELQNAAQSNQLNRLKMDEYTRGITEDTEVKNALARLDKKSPTYEQDRFNAYALKGIEGVKAYAATKKEEAAAEEHTAGTAGKKLANTEASVKLAKAAQNDILEYPSEAMVTSYYEDAKRKGYFDPETLSNIERFTKLVLSVPAPIDPATGEPDFTARRQAITRLQLEAKDRLGKPGQRNLNNVVEDIMTDPITGKTFVTGTSKMGISPADAQRIALDKQRLGLEGQRVALDERRVKVAETTGAPGYVKPLNATQQYKLDKLKTADKTNAKLFDSSIDAELKNIDKLIGTEDKPKLHAGLRSATGPIASRIFTGRTDTANAEAFIKSLQSKASINSLQTIRGTAGAIGTMTEREWPRLESMKATLQESQGTDQFIQSLKDYREELKNMKLKSKEALNTDYSTEIGANIPSANPSVDALLEKYN